MKKFLLLVFLSLIIKVGNAQHFQATIANEGNDLVFKIRPNSGGGDITTGWSDIEFFVRWPSTTPAFTFGATTINTTNFPGIVIPVNGQNAQGAEVGFTNQWLGGSFTVTPSQTYTVGTEYEVFRVALSTAAAGIEFQLVHNTNFAPTYLALTNGSGTDMSNPAGNKFYGASATICTPTNCPPTTPGTNHLFPGSFVAPCSVTAIATSNLSVCNDNGTPNNSADDTFTGDVTVTFANPPTTGTLDLTGDGTASVAVTGLTTTHTFTGVSMSADGTAIDLTAAFSATPTCTFNNTNAETAPASCSVPLVCSVTAIATSNLSVCNDNGTPNNSADDTFTADVTVTFANPPTTGTLDLTGDGTASVAVTGLTTTHTFTGVSMSADGTAIDLTAAFSATPTCTFNNTNAGTAPASCSVPLVCSVSAIATSNLSVCNDNGTPNNSADDTFTGDVTVTFANPPTTGTLDLSGDGTASVAVTGLTITHTFTGVSMSADGTAIDLTAAFSATPTCTFNNTNAETAPASCSVPLVCSVTAIATSNLSVCNDNGTPNNSADDTFTADVTVTFANPPTTGTLDLTGDGTASVAVTGLTTTHTFTGVSMSADGTAIDLTAAFSATPTCTFNNTNAGTAPASCSVPLVCSVSAIATSNLSVCNDNGTPNNSADDTFTGDVTVTFANPPTTGTLDLSGDGTASVAVTGLTITHTFTGVSMSADGTAIDLTAAFSATPTCTFNNTNSGTAPASCSVPLVCSVTAIATSNLSVCNDNGTPNNSADDTFTGDVTVTFANPPTTGTLDLTGDGTASVAVTGLTTTHTFTGVSMSADGTAIDLTAAFQRRQRVRLTIQMQGLLRHHVQYLWFVQYQQLQLQIFQFVMTMVHQTIQRMIHSQEM